MTRSQKYFYDADAIAEPCVYDRPQRQRGRELARKARLTDEHIAALRAVGLGDVGKNAECQSGTGSSTPEVLALAKTARAALGGYAREFLKKTSGNAGRKHGESVGRDSHLGRAFEWEENDAAVSQLDRHHGGMAFHARFADANRPDIARVSGARFVAGCSEDGVVLDPFFGAGTTGLAAQRLDRRCIGIELNENYAELARSRLCGDAPLFANWQTIELLEANDESF